MKSPLSLFLVLGFAAGIAAAQPAQILALAPQLQGFGGSRQNFESLAGGMSSGKTIMLSGITFDGMREEVIFTPARPMPAAETARVLGAAREALVSLGIASPSGRDIGVALMGGTLATGKGTVQMPPMIAAADPHKPLVLSVHSFAGSAPNYRNLMRGLTLGTPVTLTDPTDRRMEVSFTLPGQSLPAEEARQTLLAAYGIYDPTLEEVRAALVGGTAETPWGKKVSLRGVLEGERMKP